MGWDFSQFLFRVQLYLPLFLAHPVCGFVVVVVVEVVVVVMVVVVLNIKTNTTYKL